VAVPVQDGHVEPDHDQIGRPVRAQVPGEAGLVVVRVDRAAEREGEVRELLLHRAHLLTRLHRQAQATGDPRLAALHDELGAYPGGEGAPPKPADVAVPLRYRGDDGELSFVSITAVIGTPMDVTVEELAIESFYPADDQTAAALA